MFHLYKRIQHFCSTRYSPDTGTFATHAKHIATFVFNLKLPWLQWNSITWVKGISLLLGFIFNFSLLLYNQVQKHKSFLKHKCPFCYSVQTAMFLIENISLSFPHQVVFSKEYSLLVSKHSLLTQQTKKYKA